MRFSLRSRTAASAAPEPIDTHKAATLAAVLGVIERVRATVEEETDALRRNLSVDRLALTQRKRQGLLELSRAMRQISPEDGPARERLAGLSGALDRNRLALDRQLKAVREVADIVARSLREAESDGTYSRVLGLQATSRP